MKKLTQQICAHAMIALTLFGSPSLAAERIPEYTIKAGYLYNLALLTEWPTQYPNTSFTWCFYGEDKFGESLGTIRGKNANGRSIDVRLISRLEEVRSCQAVFVSNLSRLQFQKLKTVIADAPVLTVTDEPGMARSGVMILLKSDNRHIGLEIDLNATRRANLTLSARLLRLANVIE